MVGTSLYSSLVHNYSPPKEMVLPSSFEILSRFSIIDIIHILTVLIVLTKKSLFLTFFSDSYGVPNESKLHHQFLSVFHLLFRVGCSSIVFSDIISDVRYTISDLQYHIRHRIYYIRPPISYRMSYILYPTSNIISDLQYYSRHQIYIQL